jgi:hypothetical protein
MSNLYINVTSFSSLMCTSLLTFFEYNSKRTVLNMLSLKYCCVLFIPKFCALFYVSANLIFTHFWGQIKDNRISERSSEKYI